MSASSFSLWSRIGVIALINTASKGTKGQEDAMPFPIRSDTCPLVKKLCLQNIVPSLGVCLVKIQASLQRSRG